MLNEAKGSLLDDEQLVNTLQVSKTTSQEVGEQLTIAEQTEIKIDNAREGERIFCTVFYLLAYFDISY